ncbi:DNA-binding protein [Rhizobium leguminosarum]|uniref:DNA-binding protein n=1 Tax=Rhizobium leguminosarum TaxID=384 RepID=A0A4Q8XTN0_RHILE|nr:helix-turn-helix domain-containing protein [Rhizobium leguminosarum]TAX69315.1 DNA-binding protein [Rhizobium leguminosarum]TAY04572.1 DNA-binding protein [Rhizobium leguminosarum]
MARHASTSVTAQGEPNSIRTAFLRRATSALERISANVSAKDLADALSAPTDAGSLAQLLSRSDMVGAAINDLDPLVPALARNVEHRQNLVERAGGTMSAEDAGRILGISRQAVDKRRRAGTLLAVREGSDWRYPFCQLDQGEVIAGISDVVRGFAAAGPWIALDFLLAPDTVLGGRTPLQALRDGDREAVRRLLRIETSDGFA